MSEEISYNILVNYVPPDYLFPCVFVDKKTFKTVESNYLVTGKNQSQKIEKGSVYIIFFTRLLYSDNNPFEIEKNFTSITDNSLLGKLQQNNPDIALFLLSYPSEEILISDGSTENIDIIFKFELKIETTNFGVVKGVIINSVDNKVNNFDLKTDANSSLVERKFSLPANTKLELEGIPDEGYDLEWNTAIPLTIIRNTYLKATFKIKRFDPNVDPNNNNNNNNNSEVEGIWKKYKIPIIIGISFIVLILLIVIIFIISQIKK